VIYFLALEIRKMSFDMNFPLVGQRKMRYLCIELNLSIINIMLQLKISHELVDIVIINKF
jgi:hypothetical protein